MTHPVNKWQLSLAYGRKIRERRGGSALRGDPCKPALLALLARVREEELRAVAGERDVEAGGAPGRWTLRELVTRIAVGKRRPLVIHDIMAGGTLPRSRDVDAALDRAAAEYARLAWPALQAEAQRVHEAIIALVEALSEAELTAPQRYADHDHVPICEQVLFNAVWRPCSYLTQFYGQRSELAEAARMHETLVEAVRRLGGPPAVLASSIYSLACLYTTSGQPDRALDLLREAVRLKPHLAGWAQRDPDFVSLRDDPAFQTLLAR